ncbi:MAG: porin, partial [Dongiaceae bacterium]
RQAVDSAGTRFNNDSGQNSENVSVAATFSHDFNGVTLVLGGGATWSFDRENNGTVAPITVGGATADERAEYNAYANVSFSGFTIGGAWSLRKNISSTDSGVDAMVFGVGGTYNWDAWTVGVGWTQGQYDNEPNSAGSSATGTDKYNIIAGTASYALGPGIQIDGVIEYDDYNNTSPNDDYEGFSFGIGTLINF